LIKLQTSNGDTKIFDLKNCCEEDMIGFLNNNEITSATIISKCNKKIKCEKCGNQLLVCKICGNEINYNCENTINNIVSKPREFRRTMFIPEIKECGERISIYNDGLKIALMVHKNQNSSVFTCRKIGSIRFKK